MKDIDIIPEHIKVYHQIQKDKVDFAKKHGVSSGDNNKDIDNYNQFRQKVGGVANNMFSYCPDTDRYCYYGSKEQLEMIKEVLPIEPRYLDRIVFSNESQIDNFKPENKLTFKKVVGDNNV